MTATTNCSRCGIPLEGQADVGTDKCGWCECDIRNQRRRAQEKVQPGSLHPGRSATWCAETLGIKEGKWHSGTEDIQVRVMAVAEGYAMVRRKGAMPIVVSVKRLSPNDPSSATGADNPKL